MVQFGLTDPNKKLKLIECHKNQAKINSIQFFSFLLTLSSVTRFKGLASRVGKIGYQVIFMSCQFCVGSNLRWPKHKPFNDHVKILKPEHDTKNKWVAAL